MILLNYAHRWLTLSFSVCPQPMFSVTPSLATNANAAFNPYLGPVSPGLIPADMLPSAPILVTSNHNVPVAAAAAAQKLMRTDRLEVRDTSIYTLGLKWDQIWPHTHTHTHTTDPTDEGICKIILSLSYLSQIKSRTNKTLVNTAPTEDRFPIYANRLGSEMWAEPIWIFKGRVGKSSTASVCLILITCLVKSLLQ